MKNKEKFSKEIVEIAIRGDNIALDKNNGELRACCELHCDECAFYISCCEKRKKWAESEYVEPVKLTANEKAILNSLDEKCKWIARSSYGGLVIYGVKPLKGKKAWRIIEPAYINSMSIFNHLFQFIKWEDDEPYNIAELLKNCEVVEDE